MSETTPVPAPEPLPSDHQPDAGPTPPPPPQGAAAGGKTATVLALLALGMCIALAATAYFTWNQLQQVAGRQAGLAGLIDDKLDPLRVSLQEASLQTQRERQQVDSRLKQLAAEQQSVGQRLSVLAALMGRGEQGWSLSEVEYLLRIANQRLLLQRDVDTALVALRSADGRLRELADPHYLNVRKQIAAELEALEAVPDVDEEGISLSLRAWLERIDELPVAGTHYQPAAHPVEPGAGQERTAANWKDLPALIWTSLSELFRIREHDKPIEPMLPPEREYFLRENLRLQLAAARLALLRADQAQYKQSLENARSWLAAHFASDSSLVSEFVARLAELAALDIRPDLPELSASLRLLHQQMKLSEQQAVLPVVPAEKTESSQAQQDSAGEAAP